MISTHGSVLHSTLLLNSLLQQPMPNSVARTLMHGEAYSLPVLTLAVSRLR